MISIQNNNDRFNNLNIKRNSCNLETKDKFDYDLLKSVYNNDIKKIREMIDCGVDINMKEYDKGTTPIHIACARGHKQALELLVSRGCDVNVRNNKGSTPLHSLVTKRFDILALWLIRQGADIMIVDNNNFSPYEMAQRWFQKEMLDVSNGKLSNSEIELKEALSEYDQKQQEYINSIETIKEHFDVESSKNTNQYFISSANQTKVILPVTPSTINFQPLPPQINSEVLKFYFRGESYKSIRVNNTDTVNMIIKKMCEKFNMKSFDKCFDLVEVIKGEVRFLQQAEVILDAKSKWPLIINKHSEIYCYFSIVIKKTAPQEAIQQFSKIL